MGFLIPLVMVAFVFSTWIYQARITYFNFFMGTWVWAESMPVSRRQGGPLAVKGEDMAQGALQWKASYMPVRSFW